MAVVVDATGTKLITTVAGASVNYTSITVGTGVNRALVVTVACAAAVTAPTATWDSGASNQAMSLISVVETQTNVTTFMFALRNPVSGAKTLNVAWTGSAKSNVEAISFTGVEQASDARAFILANFAKDGATLNAITMGITPPRDSIVVASYATSATFSSLNQTNLFTDITNTGCEGGATRATGAGASISFTGTDTTTTGNKVIVGFAIVSDSAPTAEPWDVPSLSWPRPEAYYIQPFAVSRPIGPPKEDIAKVYRWFAPLAEPVRVKPALPVGEQQTLAFNPIPIPPPVRASPFAEVPKRPGFAVWQQQTLAWSTFVPAPAQVYTRWDDFARRKSTPLDTQPLAWSGLTPAVTPTSTDVVASDNGSVGPRFRYRLIYRAKTEPVFVPAATTTAIVAGEIGSSGPTFQQQFQYSATTEPAFVPPTTVVTYTPTPQWPDRVAAKPSPLNYTPLALVVPTQPTVWSQSTTRWPELLPTRKRPVTEFGTFVAPPAQVNFSYPSWPDFASVKPRKPWLQQTLAWSTFTPVPVISTDVVASDDGSAGPRFRWRLIYRTKTEPVFVPPVPASTDVVAGEAGSVGPEFQRQFQYAVKTEPVFVPAAAFTYSQLASWPDVIPVRKRPVTDFRPWTFVQTPAQVFFPYAPWDDFTRRKKPPLDTQPLAWSGFTPLPVISTDIVASDDGSAGPRFRWRLIYRTKTEPVFVPVAPASTDIVVGEAGSAGPTYLWQLIYQSQTQPAFVPAAAVVFFPDRWPDFAQPPKKKPPLNYEPLAFLQIIRSPFNSFVNWPDFATKKRPPLNYEPLTLVQTVRTPWVTMTTWPDFAHLKRKPGLGAPYQQFTARFVGTVTATTITVSMSAFEVNSDTANAVVRVIQSQPAASALVSIEETGILIDPLPGGP